MGRWQDQWRWRLKRSSKNKTPPAVMMHIHFEDTLFILLRDYDNKRQQTRPWEEPGGLYCPLVLKWLDCLLWERQKTAHVGKWHSPIAMNISFTFIEVFAEVSMKSKLLSSAYDCASCENVKNHHEIIHLLQLPHSDKKRRAMRGAGEKPFIV